MAKRLNTRADLYASSLKASYKGEYGKGTSLLGREQARFQALAQEHAHEDSFCRSVADHVAEGNPVSAKQAAALVVVADKHGWNLPIVRKT